MSKYQGNKSYRAIRTIIKDFEHTAEFKKLSDFELSKLVLHELWAKTTAGTRECNLLEEVIERLRK